MISGIIKVEVSVISRSLRLRLITLTEITLTEMLCSSPQFEIWVILYISIHIGRYLAQKRFLNFIRLASFSVYRLTLIGENNRRNGWRPGRVLSVFRSIAIIMINYLSSKFILCSDIFNSYNPRDSENKLMLCPCHEPITIEIASATAGLFYGTVYPLM